MYSLHKHNVEFLLLQCCPTLRTLNAHDLFLDIFLLHWFYIVNHCKLTLLECNSLQLIACEVIHRTSTRLFPCLSVNSIHDFTIKFVS